MAGLAGAGQVMTQAPPRNIRRLKYIEAFSAVVMTGSISAAARQLNMSQPAVSQLISNLEKSVGVALFVRRNGAIFPTQRAEALHDDARDLLALIDRIEMHLKPRTDKLLSQIRISATMSFLTEILPLLLGELHRHHPTGSFAVSSNAIDGMTNAVAEGHVDFAFHTRPLEHANIVNLLQCEVPQVCIMRADHPLAQFERIPLSQINGHDVIWPSRRDPYFQYYRDLFRRHRLNCRTALQSPFANFSIRMTEVLNALSFNNALMASIICQANSNMVWRPVEGIDARTKFYLSFPEVLSGTETQLLMQTCFASVISDALAELEWLQGPA
ncbi:LysR family transcriptional regulator [Devosia ginsengisoli]|uniref:LysR family transcriptional regulator n=1 Tax=Devosia ginsengisoli TaxID=400770 RepID=A0A5B8LVI3_9HYPH|nr:LysR family transcriptional regulator [Devosia ginsengisoli]QDZ11879.1 LysR family transcriptional regulator [Devosia ginsengisoli]